MGRTMSVRQYRIAYNLTIREMAEALGISMRAYVYKENGERDFSITEMRKIFNIFNKYNKLEAKDFFLNA